MREEGLKGTEEKKPLSQKKLMWKGKKRGNYAYLYINNKYAFYV